MPKPFIGDGPYRELGITTAALKLQLWKGYWGAKKIGVYNMLVDNVSSNEGIYPMYFSHEADFSNTGTLKNVLQRELHTPGIRYITMPSYSQYGLVFNNRRYPLNLLKFRYALAYVINRPRASLLAYGGLNLITPDKYENGVFYSLESSWLTRSQLAKLNTYPNNPAKAAKLLRSLHFTKKNGNWYEPNGKALTLQLTYQAGNNDSQGMAAAVGSELNNFGLKTEVIGAGTPAYYAEVPDGNFDIGWEFVGGGGLDPLSDQASEIGTANNYVPSVTGSSKLNPGMGFGPTVDIPGLGKVDVAPSITRESQVVGPGPQMKKLVWDWSRTINTQLPYLVVGDKNQQVEYSTYHYADWPPRRSPDWKIMGLNLAGGLLIALQQGYIHPPTASRR